MIAKTFILKRLLQLNLKTGSRSTAMKSRCSPVFVELIQKPVVDDREKVAELDVTALIPQSS